MAALVQTLPPQTITMLPHRPGSSERYNSSQSQPQTARSAQKLATLSGAGYRGMPSMGPVAPYAFTSTPQLTTNSSPQKSPYANRTSSMSTVPQLPQLSLGASSFMQRDVPSASTPTSPAPGSPGQKSIEDPSISLPYPPTAAGQSVKPSPDRYRRNVRRTETGESGTNRPQGSAMPSGSGMAAVGQLYNHPAQSNSSPTLHTYQSYRGTTYASGAQTRKTSNDDMQLGIKQSPDLASRYRRRSLGNIDTAGLNHSGDAVDSSSPHPNAFIQPPGGDYLSVQHVQRPASSHTHTGSSESLVSSRSGRSGRSSRPGSRNDSSNSSVTNSAPVPLTPVSKQDIRIVSMPARHQDGVRRHPSPLSNPSPLSKPMTLGVEDESRAAPTNPPKPQAPVVASPAAEHLAALNQKEMKRSKSKLRRAFSFGSAAELRKATAQANLEKSTASNMVNKRSSRHEDDLDPEQARIAQKQEAAGLGESIYSGQGRFFTGSTDNLSISSTASSASIMLRKMGKGVKKGTRSMIGLFRPKSVAGVPAADAPLHEASAAQVSMVTVEAEREKVNVNANPHDQVGGGTGFPKLERNSIDNKLSIDSGTASTETRSRRSIVGGERERAEVLAAVKKGILKRQDSNQSSPNMRPVDLKTADLNLPSIPHVNDSPRSSAPSTPKDEPPRSSHRRTNSITVEHSDHSDDYFSVDRYASIDSKTAGPLTPQHTNRNISFSPRIQFHDTWPSGEYDRRGEIATCNRLTPMLAQQIKEELNTFKMEMEVHESSKVYTHFF